LSLAKIEVFLDVEPCCCASLCSWFKVFNLLTCHRVASVKRHIV
jgi:hypothetical protein